jgi:catechol 2,3-dioxygenase-like lactoylglutathione lyase family enzyme
MPNISPITEYITFIYSADLEVSAGFYEQVLQLKLVLDQGTCRIYLIRPGAFIGICQEKTKRSAPRNGLILTLVTSDVDGWFDRLQANQANIVKPPALNPDFRIYHFFARDPDGYLIEFQRFLDKDWMDQFSKHIAGIEKTESTPQDANLSGVDDSSGLTKPHL